VYFSTKILDTMDLPKADKNLTLQFQAFIAETEDENGGDPMDDSEWLNLTSDDFDEFRSKWRRNAAMMPVINVSKNPLQDFQRGVKHDPAAFTVLKEIKQWDTWKRDTLAIASAQLIHDVFDEKYTPSGSTEKQLFRLQQNYVYSVLTRILTTDTGLELVRTHQDSKDAQAMFALLSKDAEKSATASLTSGDILTYITTARVGDGKWRGSVKSFIQHWSDQFRQYATLIPHADPFPDDMKLILLQNAVEPLPELRSVRQYTIQIELATGQSQTYEQYRSMVITAAETYDRKFTGRNRRKAFTHQLQDTAMIEEYEELPDYDVSTAISTIEVNAASLRQDMVPRDRWMQLDNETRTQWLRIPSNMQAIILGNQPDPIQAMDPSTPYNPGTRTPPSVRRAQDRPRPSRRPTRPDRRQASLANQVGEQEPPDEPQEEEYQQILDGVYSALEETAPERSIEVRQALFQALAADLEADPREEETIIHCNAAQLGAVSDPIWMRLNGDLYEYVATYVDDLCCALRDPKLFTDTLQEKYNFKLKGTGPINFHLGQSFSWNENGEMEISARRYVDKMIDTYVHLYGEKPRKVSSPLGQNDHPEMDDSPFLGQDETQQYQSLIGAMQWAISTGRLDIATAVMSDSSFRAMPRRGHLKRAKRAYGYLRKMKEARIRVLTKEPDYSQYQDPKYDWSSSVYGDVKEIIPTDIPEPKGKHVTLSHYFDANLYHDMVTGRSVTAILHFLNQTPVDWYSKKQATVETATFGSEFIAARTTIDQIVDLRTTLRYLGVPIREKSYVFGDNKTVIDSSSTPHAKLHKRHNALSFHRVREAVASKYVSIFHLPGQYNPADILSKHWAYASVWRTMNALLFTRGDTWDLLDDECEEE